MGRTYQVMETVSAQVGPLWLVKLQNLIVSSNELGARNSVIFFSRFGQSLSGGLEPFEVGSWADDCELEVKIYSLCLYGVPGIVTFMLSGPVCTAFFFHGSPGSGNS